MVMAGLTACNDDENISQPVVAQFQADASISEGTGATMFALVFDKASTQEGFAVIEVSSGFEGAYYLDHEVIDGLITLEIAEDDTAAFVVVTPINNQTLDGNKTLSFVLTDLSDGFLPGEKSEIEITIVDDEAPAEINFAEEAVEVRENASQARQIIIHFVSPAPAAGKISLQFDQSIENILSTDLTLVDGEAEIDVAFGATQVTFFVGGINNGLLNGHKTLGLTISHVEGALQLGESKTMSLTVLDDELIGKPKSYETSGGGWYYSKMFEYDELGRISKIHWEQRTPGTLGGTYILNYNEEGKLSRIDNGQEDYDIFTYENGRIVRSENFQFGVMKSYRLYDYDDNGNIGAMTIYHLQPNGEYKQGALFVYLNYLDGNIYKRLSYSVSVVEGQEEYHLISSETFGNYHERANPFPAFEVIPTVISQSKLPGSYNFDNGENLLRYNFSYVFNEEGLPVTRSVTGAGNEFTTYSYY